MLKLKSKSLLIGQPQDPILREHIQILAEKTEAELREKLQKQMEKQARVDAVQKQFIEWADKKQSHIREKLQKSSKNKEEHINKIVKKCKDHEKFLQQRLKNYQSKKRASMRQAWKKAEKYKNQTDANLSKTASREMSFVKYKPHNELTESHYLSTNQVKNLQYENPKQYLSLYYNGNQNSSKIYNNNSSKDYWAQLNQSLKQLKNADQHFLTQIQDKGQDRQRIKMEDKLKQTLARFRKNVVNQQQAKIQQLGERLEKIQKGRLRRYELNKQKKDKHHTNMDDEDSSRRKDRKKVDRSERIHSQSTMKEKKAHDWSFANKNKREEFFQLQLQQGTQYLQTHKIKYLKTSLTKKIALEAIEKKLYFERLHH